MSAKEYAAGVRAYRENYWEPSYEPRDSDLTACRNANPDNHVRIIGYDNKRQTQGQSIVVYRGNA